MIDAMTEAMPKQINHLDSQLRYKYGSNFLQSYYSSKNMRFDEVKSKPPQIPFFEKAKPILQNSSNFHFVEWQQENGAIDWRYVVSSTEKTPDGKDTYMCHRSFRFDEKNNRWIQEITQIESLKQLPMHDKVSNAIKPSLSLAIQENLGLRFYTDFNQSGTIDINKIEEYPMGIELKNLLPKGNVKVHYLEELTLEAPSVLTTIDSKKALTDAYGSNFEQAYTLAPTLNTMKLQDVDINQTPQLKKFMKEHAGNKFDIDFKFVNWIDENGANQSAYVIDWYSMREGQKRNYFEIEKISNNKDENTKPIKTYHSYLKDQKDKSSQSRKEPVFVIEQEYGNQQLFQILRPSMEENGTFQNLFIGIVDKTSNKCLVFNDIFPEVTYISKQPDKKKVLTHTKILTGQNPIITMPILDLEAESHHILKQVLSLRTSPTMTIAHELGHHAQSNIYHQETTDDEVSADRNVLLTIQIAREQGVDLYNGIPDNQIVLLNVGG